MRRRLTLLTHARLSDLKFEYLTTILSHKVPKGAFINQENLTIDLTYLIDNKSYTAFKLYNVNVESIDELVKLILHHLQGDLQKRNVECDMIRLNYKLSSKSDE